MCQVQMLVVYHLSWLRLCSVSCVLIQTRHFLCVFVCKIHPIVVYHVKTDIHAAISNSVVVRHTDNTITRIRNSGNDLKNVLCRGQFKCDATCTETRFRLSAKRMSPFKLAGASVQSITGSWGVHISGSNAGYTMSEVVWRVLANHSICQFPLHFPSHVSLCAITFQLESTRNMQL